MARNLRTQNRGNVGEALSLVADIELEGEVLSFTGRFPSARPRLHCWFIMAWVDVGN